VLNIQTLSDFRSCISPFVLLDSKSALGGGSGESIDKEVLKALKQEVGDRLCVAGGVGRNNIQFLKELDAKMLDVNSSLESSLGKKDPQKVREFLKVFTNDFRS
ncbi:MAG: bifunctional indole-3-glycerol phosphate synthase/phosphoribosylanthranilate isomerase, partial [Helicobacter sp.]|nr:bifunctional indole-3-glycerol phosphate synthase/phosphoribosylanthranilate isomerase [Helicobacter sp.]